MGNCCKTETKFSMPKYPNSITLNIKNPNSSKSGQKLNMTLLPPSKQFRDHIKIGDLGLKISSCIYSGQDLEETHPKQCQDSTFLIKNSNFIFATLFDGHGTNGQEVIQFCESFMTSYIESEAFKESAGSEYLEDMFMLCDDELISKKSNIDVSNSGTTAVSIIISPKALYVASVGDSRAVLGTQNLSSVMLGKKNSKKFDLVIESLQLTVDQKPNLEEEMSRIIRCGGVVTKALDKDGIPHGPYRVFCKNYNEAGLAMSRSFGDLICKKIGVLAQPIHERFPIYAFRDKFIIIASDGLWDVFDNNEAVQYVETFRHKFPGKIADLLAEEARYRWTDTLNKGQTQIDDISVMIIEFSYFGTQENYESYTETRSSSKNLGSVVEVQSDAITISTRNIRNTLIC